MSDTAVLVPLAPNPVAASNLDKALAFVDKAYDTLKATPGFVFRESQQDLSRAATKSFLGEHVLVGEAPTGTGKTVAYLIGALAAAHVNKKPIVIATATKALQSQLILSDLPRLTKIGLVDAAEVALAKGKGNYLCLDRAEDVAAIAEAAEDDVDIYMGDSPSSLEDALLVQPMLEDWQMGAWDGDFDNYVGTRPKSLSQIQVTSETCTGKKCSHYKECAYYKSKRRIQSSQIVIANHDLLLIDTMLVAEEMEPTLQIGNYYAVIDEAHHLPSKALDMGASSARLSQLLGTMPKLAGLTKLLMDQGELKGLLQEANFDIQSLNRTPSAVALKHLLEQLDSYDVDTDTYQRRFPQATVPMDILKAIAQCNEPLEMLRLAIMKLHSVLREKGEAVSPPAKEGIAEVFRRTLDALRLLKDTYMTFLSWTTQTAVVKWLYRKESSVVLHAVPLDPSILIKKLFWDNLRSKPIFVSATLRDLNGFQRFSRQMGLPKNTETMTLPYSFPYGNSQLIVAGLTASPKPGERKQFLPELKAQLKSRINKDEGTLLLFPSWVLLNQIAPFLKETFGAPMVRVQNSQTIKVLVAEHKAAIDKHRGSILVGVATMAEGLDLPGAYCTHVGIITLPFAVPTDPVEQEIAELMGSRYFNERSLPDAMIKLIQMVGRLIRREDDIGRVTIFDNRLGATSYGRKMLEALPPFEKIIEKPVL